MNIPTREEVLAAFDSFGDVRVHHVKLKSKLRDDGFDYGAAAGTIGSMVTDGALMFDDRTGNIMRPAQTE